MITIPVQISSGRPFFVEADAISFADIFAHANSEEQAEILRLCLETTDDKLTLQLDQIGLELEKDKYKRTRELMRKITDISL